MVDFDGRCDLMTEVFGFSDGFVLCFWLFSQSTRLALFNSDYRPTLKFRIELKLGIHLQIVLGIKNSESSGALRVVGRVFFIWWRAFTENEQGICSREGREETDEWNFVI